MIRIPPCLGPVLLLGCIHLPGEDGQVASDRDVMVGDIRVRPLANLSGRDGRLRYHPKGSVGLAYDSNVLQRDDDEEDDLIVTALAGIDLRYWTGESSDLEGVVEIYARDYQDFDERDLLGADADLTWRHQTDLFKHQLQGGYQRLDDPLVETGRRVERQRFHAGYEWHRYGNYNDISVVSELAYDDYLEAGTAFDRHQRDHYSLELQAGWARALDPELDLVLRLGFLGVHYPDGGSDEVYQDSSSPYLMGGVGFDSGNRTRFTVLAGVKARFFDDDFAGDPSFDDEEEIGPMAVAELAYDHSEQGTVALGARADLIDGAGSNAASILTVGLDLVQGIGTRWRLVAGVEIAHRENSGSAAGARTTRSDAIEAEIGADYLFRTGFALGLRASHRHFDSNQAGDDYRQQLVELSAAVAF